MGNALNLDKLHDSLLTFEGDKTFTLKDSTDIINQFGGVSSTALFLGFNFKRINNLQINVDGYGRRANKMYMDFFVHLIFAPVMSARNYTLNDVSYNVKYEDNKRIGWRMGWSFRKPKAQGFSAKFEFGQRPLLATVSKGKFNMKNMYMMFTYGIYIPVKLEPIAME